jgi:hypothetical protein
MIGRIEGRPGEVLVLGPDGQILKLAAGGFTHF